MSFYECAKLFVPYPPDGFAGLNEAREWCRKFVHWYNDEHHHSGIRLFTPSQRHSGEAVRLMGTRDAVYAAARSMHPERWNGRKTRNWELPAVVMLNSDRSLLGHGTAPEKQAA